MTISPGSTTKRNRALPSSAQPTCYHATWSLCARTCQQQRLNDSAGFCNRCTKTAKAGRFFKTPTKLLSLTLCQEAKKQCVADFWRRFTPRIESNRLSNPVGSHSPTGNSHQRVLDSAGSNIPAAEIDAAAI